METVKRKQPRKGKKNKSQRPPSPSSATSSPPLPPPASQDDNAAVVTAPAVTVGGVSHGDGDHSAMRTTRDDSWTLEDEDWSAASRPVEGEASASPAAGRAMEDEIAQHEDDILALLAVDGHGADNGASSVQGLPSPVRVPRRHDGGPALVMTSAPSAPSFNDSDDEDEQAQRTIAPAVPLPAAEAPAPISTAELVQPSAPDFPFDSPSRPKSATEQVESVTSPAYDQMSLPTEDPYDATRNTSSTFEQASAPVLSDDEQIQEGGVQKLAMIAPPKVAITMPDSESVVSRTEIARSVTRRAVQKLVVDAPEKAGSMMRHSFARIATGRLYPSVVRGESSTQHSSSSDMPLHNREELNRAETPTVFIKVEPHTNFEMNLLRAAAAQKRQETKMHNIEINKGDLFCRLERYLYAEYLLQIAISTHNTRKNDVDASIQKVWTVESSRLSSSKECGDHVELNEVLEFQTAKFEPLQHMKLKKNLETLRQSRTVEASLHTFDRALSYFHVEQYLNDVLEEPSLVSHLNKMSASVSARQTNGRLGEFEIVPEGISFYERLPSGSALATAVDHLKYCLDVMIFFEKQVTVEERGLFGRVPPSFARGEVVWQSTGNTRGGTSGSERRIRCYVCGNHTAPMEPNSWCKFCDGCGVVLYTPPSSVSTNSSEWYTSVLRFREALQKWISVCLRQLLRLRSLVNMPYILMHIMYLPRVATEERSWVLRFLQFPKAVVTIEGDIKYEWSEELVDHYIAMLHLVFHPEKLRRLAMLVSSESTGNRRSSSKTEPGKISPEWVLLENPDVLDRCFLSDEDFVAVMNQFPHAFAFDQMFACSMDAKKCFSRAMAIVIEFTQCLRAFQEFEQFPACVAKLLCELLRSSSIITAGSATNVPGSDAIFYPTLFDQLLLTALHGLVVADCNRVAWRSIRNFPFGPLSDRAKWDVFGLLLFGMHHVANSSKCASGWIQFVEKSVVGNPESTKHARNVLYDQICTDPDNSMHLLHAVARLAASIPQDAIHKDDLSGRDLILITTQELFLAGFANLECRRALGESGERAAGPISTICLAHPWVISELISLLFKYHECADTWIHVFETFPVNRWYPTPGDLTNLQEWLQLEDTSSPRSALARFLLDRINWEYDAKSGQLFTSPYLHRQVALVVVESLVSYRRRQEQDSRSSLSTRASPPKLSALKKSIRRALRLESSVDFEQWCWRLMLKLKFYSPSTHRPFVDLIDLRTDRSREGLLLRRWFPGAVAHAGCSGGIKIPFYASLDPFVRGNVSSTKATGADDLSMKLALAGAGSTGAPIQQSRADVTSNVIEEEDSPEIEATVAVISTCEVEPIVAYLVCQVTTFVFSDRMDRWEPLLALLKSGCFHASVKVLENILPLLAQTTQAIHSERMQKESMSAGGATETNTEATFADHEVQVCMAAMETLTSDQLIRIVQSMESHSYISANESTLLCDLLQKGYIGGWEGTAKSKVLEKLKFVRECSRYLHPLVLPAMVNEAFPTSSTSSIMSTSALLQGAMSWLTSALLGGGNDPPSPSAAHSITSALTARRSHLIASIPASSSSAVSAAAAAASLGMLESPPEYTETTRLICMNIERSFDYATPSMREEFAIIWMKSISQVPFWFEHPALRHIVDVLIRCSIHQVYFSGSSCSSRETRLRCRLQSRLVGIIQLLFYQYCNELKNKSNSDNGGLAEADGDWPPVVSFLPVACSSSIFGVSIDVAQYVSGCSMFAFWTLLVETRHELPLFQAMGQLFVKHAPAPTKVIEKMRSKGKLSSELQSLGTCGVLDRSGCVMFGHLSIDHPSQFRIYRWAQYCINLPEDDGLQILYWQVFFSLYFACAGGSRVFGHNFVEWEENDSTHRQHLRKTLQGKLRSMTTYCANQAQLMLTTSVSNVNGASLSVEGKERKYHHFVQLSHIYTAMDSWLEEQNPQKWLQEEEFATLPRHFDVARLKGVLRLSDQLVNTVSDHFDWDDLVLWFDLCGFEYSVRSSPHDDAVAEQDQLSTKQSFNHIEDDDFAIVDDADARRHSSLGYSMDGRGAGPLPLTPEHWGPLSLTILPHVNVETTVQSCVVSLSMPLNKAGLKTVSMKFSETLSILVGLDAELLDQVSKLYSSKARVVAESKTCLEGTNCRQPAAFRFVFTEWTMDTSVHESVRSLLGQASRYDLAAITESRTMTTAFVNVDFEGSQQQQGLLFEGIETFLRLDADSLMVSLQVLLIDRVVFALGQSMVDCKKQLEIVQASALHAADQKRTSADRSDNSVLEMDNEVKETDDLSVAQSRLDRLHEKGLEWFRQLTEMDTKLSRMVPPLREVLWRSIKQLGVTFVCVDERETCNLLQLMLEEPSRITLLAECFSPAGAPSRFVEMFSSLMSSSSTAKLTEDEKLLLLRRFDFLMWLNTKPPHTPTKFDRETVLTIILGDISNKAANPRSNAKSSRGQTGSKISDDVQRVYSNIIRLLCEKYLGDHLEKVLHSLVGVHNDYRFKTVSGANSDEDMDSSEEPSGFPQPAPAMFWEAVVAVPATVWKTLPFSQSMSCVLFLNQHMTGLRWKGSILPQNSNESYRYPLSLWQRNGVLKSLLDLFSLLWHASPELEQWGLLTKFFEPLMSTLYQPSTTTESSRLNCPWSEQDSLSTGTTLCSCFVALCTDYLKTAPAAPAQNLSLSQVASPISLVTIHAKLDALWRFYVSILIPNAPVHICRSFHQFLTRLSWEQWRLSLELVQEMRELVKLEKNSIALPSNISETSRATSYPYISWMIRDVLCRMTWKATDTWLTEQTDAIRSLLLLELAKLLVDLVLDFPHFRPLVAGSNGSRTSINSSSNVLPPYFVNFIKQQSTFWAKWAMSSPDLSDLLKWGVDTVLDPLCDLSANEIFPSHPTVVMAQDAFARLQLVLRLLSQVTTINHPAFSTQENLKRVNHFLSAMFRVFDQGFPSTHESMASDRNSWRMVLFGAACTVLYEKLDEVVLLNRVDTRSQDVRPGSQEQRRDATVSVQDTVVEVLRLFNLRLVEPFFRDGHHLHGSLAALNWSKCGNVVFVEVDSLIREFASLGKSPTSSSISTRSHSVVATHGTELLPLESPVDVLGGPLGRLLWSFMGFRGGELSCLSACGRAIASVHVMSHVAEKSIEKWIIEESCGSWDDLVSRLRIPELSEDDFEDACLAHGNILTLEVYFLQQLRKVPVLTEAFAIGMLSKVMSWMDRLHMISTTNAVIEMKILFLVAEVTNFVHHILADVLPSPLKKQTLRDLCDVMLRFGNARRQHGIMKAIGIGGSLKYNIEFHVCSLAIGIFLRLQTRKGAPLRIDDRIPFKQTRTTEKHLKSLEQLLATKNCFQLQKRMEWIIEFLKSPNRTLADQDEFFVSLFSRIYPTQPWLLVKCIVLPPATPSTSR